MRARDFMGKRLTGWINWRRGRSAVHDMNALAALVEDMKRQNPDHIACTGDVANVGLPAEYVLAQAFLRELGDCRDVSFTPGNHDAYVRSSLPHMARAFAPWTSDEPREEAAYPYMRVRGDVALIGLCSGVPTAPLLASGKLGQAQREATGALLDEAGAKGLCRVILIHHPPQRAGAASARGLMDARHFETMIARHGAELILHGHNHKRSIAHVRGPDRKPVPIVGVASASAAGGTRTHRAGYNLFKIARENGRYKIDGYTRGLSADRRGMTDLGPIQLF
jgi:3',5'-cyclic AMP phosphodiesterase CpdA